MSDMTAYIGRPPVQVRFGENTEAALQAAAQAQAVLTDPGFVLVAGDLALGGASKIAIAAANIGVITDVAANESNINTVAGLSVEIAGLGAITGDISILAPHVTDIESCADNMAAILAAPGAASAAITAASSVFVTSYSHAFSTGNRTATMVANGGTFTTDLTLGGGTIDNLIDGATGNTNTDGVAFNAQDVTGKAFFQWTVPIGESPLCDEIKLTHSGAIGLGNGKAQRLTHAGVWEDAGTPQAIGGATTVTFAVACPDKGGYAGFRIFGTSGTSSGSGRALEAELKLADGTKKGVLRLPAGGLEGDRLGKTGTGSYSWSARYGSIPAHAGVNRMALFMCDDDYDGGMIRNRLADQYHFDFRTDRGTYGPAPTKSAKGWLFKKNMVRLNGNITGVRTVAALIRKERGNNTLYEIYTNVAGAPIYLRGSDFRGGTGGSTIRVLAPNGEIMPVFGDTSGTNTAGATFLNRGYWHLCFIELGSAMSAGLLSLGGQTTATADTTHAAFAEFAYMSFFDGQLSDAMCKAEANWLCPIMARERGIVLRNDECTRLVDLLLMWGQSNIGGDAPLWDTPRQLLSMKSIPAVLIQSANRRDRAYMRYPAPYDAGTTSLMGALQPSVANSANPNYQQHDDRKYGPDWQIARLFSLAAPAHARQLVINKVGADGTILAAPGEGGGGSTSWHPLTAWNTGVLGHALTRLYETWQWLLNQGIGFDIPAFWWGQGETTVGSAGNTVQTANWGDDFNDMFAAIRTYTANMVPLLRILTRLREWETGCVGDPTLTAQLRTIQDGLGSADPTNVKILSADGNTADVWGRTPGYHPEVGGQFLHYNGALLDRLATDAYALIPWSAS